MSAEMVRTMQSWYALSSEDLTRTEKSTGYWDVIDFLCRRIAGSREYFGTGIGRGVCLLAWKGNVLLT